MRNVRVWDWTPDADATSVSFSRFAFTARRNALRLSWSASTPAVPAAAALARRGPPTLSRSDAEIVQPAGAVAAILSDRFFFSVRRESDAGASISGTHWVGAAVGGSRPASQPLTE